MVCDVSCHISALIQAHAIQLLFQPHADMPGKAAEDGTIRGPLPSMWGPGQSPWPTPDYDGHLGNEPGGN